MRTIWFTIGPPGCGKSTFANNLVSQRADVATVHRDGIRAALFGSKRAFWDNPTEERRQLVRQFFTMTLERLLKRTELNIILPNTNLDLSDWHYTWDKAAEFKCSVHTVIFSELTFDDVCQRNVKRHSDDQLSMGHLTRYFDKYNAPDAYWRNKDFKAQCSLAMDGLVRIPWR